MEYLVGLMKVEIKWGDSITKKVNEGLKVSRYLIVVLSLTFMGKNWPQRELFAALNQEASTGEVKVLPLLIGNKEDREIIIGELPLLNDKRYLIWEGKPESIVEAILTRLSGHPKKNTGHLNAYEFSTGELCWKYSYT